MLPESVAAGRNGATSKTTGSRHTDIDILDKWVVVMDENFYTPPIEVQPGDTSQMMNLDTDKLIELREVRNS